MSEAIGYYKPASQLGLDIIYQDEAILVLNKPNGLLSVPGRGEDKQDSLATRAQAEFPDALIVHRLDMATSGIMVMALGTGVQRELGKAFAKRAVKKKYIAVVDGRRNHEFGCVDLPLRTDWPNRPRQKIHFELGKASITHYKLLHYDAGLDASRTEITPETGRTHQIRVHMLSLGHTIVGDRLYGKDEVWKKSPRLLLHAQSLSFLHPVTKAELFFECKATF